MDATSFLGGEYVKSDMLKAGPKRGVITSGGEVRNFEAKAGQRAQRQLVIAIDFGTEEKKFGLNQSNLKTLIDAFGGNTAEWVGKEIALYFDPNVSFGGRTVGGVRIKVPAKRQAAPAPAPVVDVRQPGDDDDDITF
jgi:hypothetical protein